MCDRTTDVDGRETARPASAPTSDLDPYADTEESELPEWWQRAKRIHERHGLLPYRPPRLADGTPKHEIQSRLESDLDVNVRFRCRNPEQGADWTLLVDGQPAGRVGRHRSRDGYTVYELTPAELRTMIREAAGDGSADPDSGF